MISISMACRDVPYYCGGKVFAPVRTPAHGVRNGLVGKDHLTSGMLMGEQSLLPHVGSKESNALDETIQDLFHYAIDDNNSYGLGKINNDHLVYWYVYRKALEKRGLSSTSSFEEASDFIEDVIEDRKEYKAPVLEMSTRRVVGLSPIIALGNVCAQEEGIKVKPLRHEHLLSSCSFIIHSKCPVVDMEESDFDDVPDSTILMYLLYKNSVPVSPTDPSLRVLNGRSLAEAAPQLSGVHKIWVNFLPIMTNLNYPHDAVAALLSFEAKETAYYTSELVRRLMLAQCGYTNTILK